MIITPYAFFSAADIKSVIPAIPNVKKYAKIKAYIVPSAIDKWYPTDTAGYFN